MFATSGISMSQVSCIDETKKWIEKVIIAHNFCPFAKREFVKRSIHFEALAHKTIESSLEALILACEQLDQDPEIETTLLIFTDGFQNFEEYLDLLDIADRLLEARRYEGIYQLASFHPKYCFDEAAPDDPANYTNRSPYPMLHLLREATIEASLKNIDNPEEIPQNNIDRARSLGLDALKKQLEDCYQRV